MPEPVPIIPYGERSEDVRCPKHDKPLALVADGVLNGTRVTYWGQCPGGEPRPGRTCMWHRENPRTPDEWPCACREPKPPAPCHFEERVAEVLHTEPSLPLEVDRA